MKMIEKKQSGIQQQMENEYRTVSGETVKNGSLSELFLLFFSAVDDCVDDYSADDGDYCHINKCHFLFSLNRYEVSLSTLSVLYH